MKIQSTTSGLVLVLRTSGEGALVRGTHDAINSAGPNYASVDCTVANARREVGKADLIIFVGKASDEATAVLEKMWQETGLPIFFVVKEFPGNALDEFHDLVTFGTVGLSLAFLEEKIREELTVGEIKDGVAIQSRLPDILVDLTTNGAVVLAAQNIPLRYRAWFLADNCLGEGIGWMGDTYVIVADVTVGFGEGKRRIFVVETPTDDAPTILPKRPSLVPVEVDLAMMEIGAD